MTDLCNNDVVTCYYSTPLPHPLPQYLGPVVSVPVLKTLAVFQWTKILYFVFSSEFIIEAAIQQPV